jgi:hypothetical protein
LVAGASLQNRTRLAGNFAATKVDLENSRNPESDVVVVERRVRETQLIAWYRFGFRLPAKRAAAARRAAGALAVPKIRLKCTRQFLFVMFAQTDVHRWVIAGSYFDEMMIAFEILEEPSQYTDRWCKVNLNSGVSISDSMMMTLNALGRVTVCLPVRLNSASSVPLPVALASCVFNVGLEFAANVEVCFDAASQ